MTVSAKKRSFFLQVTNYTGFGVMVALGILLIVAAVFTPAFFSFSSVSSMLTNNAIYAMLTVGVTCVLLTGEIDISVGAILAISGVTVTQLAVAFPHLPPVLWVVTGVVIGCLCGGINGFLVGKMRLSSLIVTLGTMYIFRGLAYVTSNGQWFFPNRFSASFTALAQQDVIGLDAVVLWAAALFVAAALFLGCTRPGRHLYAVGSGGEAAEMAGINVAGVKTGAFVLCGAVAGLAGTLYCANYAMVNSDIGNGYEMTAIAICVLGGVSITGGVGRTDGLVLATLLMSVIRYLLSLLSGMSVWQMALQGAIIIVAVLINVANGKLTATMARRERGHKV